MRRRTSEDEKAAKRDDVWPTVRRYIDNAILSERHRCINIIRREETAQDRDTASLLERIVRMIEEGVAVGEDR